MSRPGKLILVLGGARSGKSRFAVELAAGQGQPVVFVATAQPTDPEMKARIEAHRRARPRHWETVEAWEGVPSILRAKGRANTVVVIDCLTLMLSNLLLKGVGHGSAQGTHRVSAGVVEETLRESERVAEAARSVPATVIVVANEVGAGVVPATALGRAFRDLAGAASQIVAAYADEVYVMHAGIPTRIKGHNGANRTAGGEDQADSGPDSAAG